MPSELSVAFFPPQVPPKHRAVPVALDTVCHLLRKSAKSAKLFNFSLDSFKFGCILGSDAEVLRLSFEVSELSDSVAAGATINKRVR